MYELRYNRKNQTIPCGRTDDTVSRQDRKERTIGQKVRHAIVRHFNKVSSIVMLHLVGRVAAMFPLLMSVSFGKKLPLALGIALSGVLYFAVVLFMRFWGRESFRRMFYSRHHTHKPKSPTEKWLKTGLMRLFRGCIWGLPFLAGVVYFTVFYRKLDAKTFWMPIRYLAYALGQEPNIAGGALVALVLMGLFGLLFAYGWMRDMPVEYLPVRSLGVEQTFHWSRKLMKNYRGPVWKNAAVNMLLSLPALIGLGVVIVPYVRKNIDFSLSPDLVLSMLGNLLREKLPNKELLLIAGILLVLYLPLCVYRKMRNAALVGKLMKDSSHKSREEDRRSSSAGHTVEPKYVNLEGTPLGSAEHMTANLEGASIKSVEPKRVNLEGTPLARQESPAPQESDHEA